MTNFDQMAYNDPVGAQHCRDAGRFGEPNAQAEVETAPLGEWRHPGGDKVVCHDPACPCQATP